MSNFYCHVWIAMQIKDMSSQMEDYSITFRVLIILEKWLNGWDGKKLEEQISYSRFTDILVMITIFMQIIIVNSLIRKWKLLLAPIGSFDCILFLCIRIITLNILYSYNRAIGTFSLGALAWLCFCCSTFFPRARDNHRW